MISQVVENHKASRCKSSNKVIESDITFHQDERIGYPLFELERNGGVVFKEVLAGCGGESMGEWLSIGSWDLLSAIFGFGGHIVGAS